ncbi:MAG: hypothetical protein IIX69_07865 [Clostridia bacterium]|nr:hypothetical protein [Clostridia bacterium]MBQ5809310.1 hypothetical protein [Clostridia bacterium]
MIVMFIFTVEAIILFFFGRFVYSFIRSVKLQTQFTARLKTLCERKGYECEVKRGVVSTALFMASNTDICVKTEKNEYHIRVMPCLYPKKSYHFATVEHVVSWYPQLIKIISKKAESFYNGFTSYRYCPKLLITEVKDVRIENILLFDPAPFNLTKANEHGFHIPVEDGDSIGSYKAYRAKAFLELLGTPAQSAE